MELDFSTVFKLCLRDADQQVRQRAIAGLWECEDSTLIPRLVELLRGDPSLEVKAAAAIGLGKFAQLAVEGNLLEKHQKRVETALLEVLRRPEDAVEVRRKALEAMAPFNTPEVQEFIQKAYEGDHAELRCSAIYSMGKSADPRWFSVLVRELKSSDPAVRYEAVNACGELGTEEAVAHLAPLVRDEDYQVQLAAVQACGRIGGRQAKRLLQSYLSSSDQGIVEAVEEALRQMELEDDNIVGP
ncbi:MAG: HEAT repeat domain-containing protein [Dehalococcoidia bacterium]|nr:HEAT repeat domain-containing protein [Dehalococcoidia bacterium]